MKGEHQQMYTLVAHSRETVYLGYPGPAKFLRSHLCLGWQELLFQYYDNC